MKQIPLFICSCVLLFFINTAKAQNNLYNQPIKITYLLSHPDPWGDPFWRYLNQDDKVWRTAADLSEIGIAVEKENPEDVYLRIVVDHTPQSINNLYFKVAHSGPFEIFVNGKESGGSKETSEDKADYTIWPRRPEHLGENVYAIHFKNIQDKKAKFNIQLINKGWLCTDQSNFIPKVLLPDLMRDAAVTKGPDAWYMTATTGADSFLLPNPRYWMQNPGIQVFKSADLKNWKSLGYVWTFEKDGTWNKEFGRFGGRGPTRGIFAPEIKYINHKYWINYSVNNATDNRFFGIGLLSSKKAEGPYKEVSPEKPLTEGFDSNLFTDEDGTTYMLKHGGMIAKLKPDFSGFTEEFRWLGASNYPQVGYEGVHMFKYKGKYYLTSAEWNVHADGKVSYDCMVASSDNIYGPYGDRYCAVRYGGHNSFFEGPKGEMYATVWCYPYGDDHWQRLSIVKMKLHDDGRFYLVPEEL